MKKIVDISVIVPVYNVEEYLAECLDSIICQIFSNMEIIIINDGSTDSSGKIADSYIKKDNRIKVIHQKNRGLSSARNIGIKIAKGEYISFIDSDDYIDSQMLSKMYNYAKQNTSDITVCGFYKVSQYGDKKCFIESAEQSFENMLGSKIHAIACDKLYKKELFTKNAIEYPDNLYHEDVATTFKLYYYANKIAYLPLALYYWRTRYGSIGKSISEKHINDFFEIFVITKDFLEDKNIFHKYEIIFLRRCFAYIRLLFNKINNISRDGYLRKHLYNQLYNNIERTGYLSEKNLILMLNHDKKMYISVLDYILGKEIILDNIENMKNSLIECKKALFMEELIDESIMKYAFSQRLNVLHLTTLDLSKKYKKIALYGFGLIGKMVANILIDQLSVIVDIAEHDAQYRGVPIRLPNELDNFEYEILVICVLGRENEVEKYLKSLKIKKNNIFKYNLLGNSTQVSLENNLNEKKTIKENIKKYSVVFLPHKDYHVWTMGVIGKELKKMDISSCILDLTDFHRDEGSRSEAKNFPEIPFLDFGLLKYDKIDYDCIVCMNDWETKVVRPQIEKAKVNGKITIGIVEGVQDFFDLDIKYQRNPYKTVEYVFFAGEHDKQFFKNQLDKTFIVGIPRLQKLLEIQPTFPDKPLAIINLNFSYNVLSEKAKLWLDSAINGCNKANINYIISQHPADTTDLKGYQVTDKTIYQIIEEGSIVISRFGSTIIEALVMGKPCIYHNPHNEKVIKYQESKGAYSLSFDTNSLVKAIKFELSLDVDYRKRANKFLKHHCDINNKHSSAFLSAKIIKQVICKQYDYT